MKRALTLLAALALGTLTTSSASAGLSSRTDATYHFEVRAMGSTVATASLRVSALKRRGPRLLRQVSLRAATSGLGRAVYESETRSTTWIDGHWLPVSADWYYQTPKGERHLTAGFWRRGKAGGAKGVYKRKGLRDYATNFRLKQRPTDMVSVFALLPSMDLKPGQTFRMPLYDGWRVYDLRAEVGKPTPLLSATKKAKVSALPVVMVATSGKIKRRVVYWLDAVTLEPLQLSFSYGMLGSVEAVVVKVDKKQMRPLRLSRRATPPGKG